VILQKLRRRRGIYGKKKKKKKKQLWCGVSYPETTLRVAGWVCPGSGAHVKGGHWGKKKNPPPAMEHVIIPVSGTRFPTHIDF
jgi:hypothetical protein